MSGRRLRLPLVAAVLLALPGGAVRAQPKLENAEATPRFDSGVEQYNLGHYAEAITEFEAAYEIAPSPILLFNLAQCHRHLGNKERALFLYRRYLEQAPKAANRADVDHRVAELEQALRDERAAAYARAHGTPSSPAPAAGRPVAPPAATTVSVASPAAAGAHGRWRG